jgi:hypothetical protein
MTSFLGYGLAPLVINFIWQANTCQKSKIQILFLPIKIPISYLPWIYLLFSATLSQPFGSNAIYCFLGLFQHRLRKRSYLALPLSIYEGIEKVIPNFVKNLGCFTKISYIKEDLKEICQVGIFDLCWSGESSVTEEV